MTTQTLEQANEAMRTAVRERLDRQEAQEQEARPGPLAGCKPAEEAAAKVLTDAWQGGCCEGKRGPSAAEVLERFSPTHPTSQRFYDLCDRLKAMHESKSSDYGCPSGRDPLANIRNGATFVGIEPWKGAMVRLSDKVTRLATFNVTGTLGHEGVEDTLLDLASYALLALLLYQEEHRGTSDGR
jgi:hypothetical protein